MNSDSDFLMKRYDDKAPVMAVSQQVVVKSMLGLVTLLIGVVFFAARAHGRADRGYRDVSFRMVVDA